MRFIHFKLSLSFALLFVAASASATPIALADCTVNAALCHVTPNAFGILSMSAGTQSYYSPSGLQTDTHSVTGSYMDISAAASGSINVDFSGIHTVLSSTGDVFCGRDSCPYSIGANSSSTGFIIDYIGTGANVPLGAQLEITYSVDASGNTVDTIDGYSESDIYTRFFINGDSAPGTCTASTAAYSLNGSYSNTCTVTVPVSSLEVLSMQLYLFGSTESSYPVGATLNASNTAKITSALLVDSNGNPLPDAQLYDASGYDYNSGGASISPTPEPSGLTLLAAGCLGIAGLVRRRRLV